jgi:cell division protease FtsH
MFMLLALTHSLREGKPEKISLTEFRALLASEQFSSGRLEGTKFVGELKPGFPASESGVGAKAWVEVDLPPEGYLSEDLFRAMETIPDFAYKEPNVLWQNLLIGIIPWILFAALIWFFFLRQLRAPGGAGSVLSFGKSRAKLAGKGKTSVTFEDVAGIEEAKEEVREIIDYLKSPAKFMRLGARIPRGVLLVGQPGTGKTLLAKAIAGEAAVPFFTISGSDFVEMFVGVGASRVRDLFREAKESSPCIIFLDEIDAVGRQRGTGLGGGHDEREQTLNAILVEMDGFERDEGIIVVAATNRPDVLDPALLRPGRFDRQIVIDLPDIKGRESILKVHGKKTKLADDADLAVLGRSTAGLSGADLEAVINEAAISAAMHGKDDISMSDLEEARDKVRWGKRKRSKVMSDEERRITAFHEAGHAFVNKSIPEVDPFYKATIIPQGMALGATMQLPETDRYHIKMKAAMGQITVLCAGRVAEVAFCEDISAGAQSDIKQATELARKMVCEWGMSESLGLVNYTEGEEHLFLGRELTRAKPHSEAMAQEIDHEIRRIIDSCYDRAEDLITEHRDQLERIALALLKYESLDSKDLDTIIAGEELVKSEPAQSPSEEENEREQPERQESAAEMPEEERDAAGKVQT